MEDDLQITAVQLAEGGDVEIAYIRVPTDVRKNGLVWQHSVHIPSGSDYDDELHDFREALLTLLLDALDDETTAEPIDMTPEEGDE